MGIIDDPISGTIGTILQHGLEKNLFKLVRLVFTLAVVAAIAFLISAGGALVSGLSTAQAIGTGMVVAGTCMLGTYRISDDSKGIKLAFTEQLEQTVQQQGLKEDKHQ